jgi:hypothetical protein
MDNHKQPTSTPHVSASQHKLQQLRSLAVWSWIGKLKGSDNSIVGTLVLFLVIGLGLLLVGAIVPAGKGNGWVPIVGGTLFGASLAALFSFSSARYSVLEGYRKEANLRRKDELYGPLYTELRSLREYLEDAQNGNNPFPQWIDIEGEQYPNRYALHGFTMPHLHLWPQFRSDYRIDNFSPASRQLLDETLKSATAYNRAVYAVRPIVKAALKQEIHAAVSKIESKTEYKHWHRQYQEHIEQHVPFADMLNADDTQAIYAAVAFGTSYGTAVDEAWSNGWLEALPTQQPETLGWLLAAQPERAASCVYDALKRTATPAVAPIAWYTEIFTQVCKHIADKDEAMDVYHSASSLLEQLAKAEQRITEALQYIRERYEGGEPPL